MNTKVATAGPGRIGRAILKWAIDERVIELVAVKDCAITAPAGVEPASIGLRWTA